MNREELISKITDNSSCTKCEKILNTYLDEYDKHVIAEYESKHGNLADMIRDIHDCVAREMYCKGIDDIKCCLILNSRTESINGKVHLIITEDRISFIADQLKENINDKSL